MIRRPAIAVGGWLDVWMENYAKSNCGHPHSKPRKASSRTTSSRRLAASRCPRCWVTTPRALRWIPTPTSPPTPNSRQHKPWGTSSPVPSDAFRYPLPLGSAFGQETAVRENRNICKTKIPEILRFRGFLARREGFEPPAFWSVAAGISSWAISSRPTCNLQNPCIFNGFTGFSAQTSRQPCICNRPENSNSVRKVLEISLLLS